MPCLGKMENMELRNSVEQSHRDRRLGTFLLQPIVVFHIEGWNLLSVVCLYV